MRGVIGGEEHLDRPNLARLRAGRRLYALALDATGQGEIRGACATRLLSEGGEVLPCPLSGADGILGSKHPNLRGLQVGAVVALVALPDQLGARPVDQLIARVGLSLTPESLTLDLFVPVAVEARIAQGDMCASRRPMCAVEFHIARARNDAGRL